MNLNTIIAANLKRLRADRQLSLGKLAELCGVSKVMLGQIERGESNPTINTIWKIASGLKVPYTALIDEPMESSICVRKENAKFQSAVDGKYRLYCYFTNHTDRNFELFSVELDPHTIYESFPHGEKAQEYILIDHGELTLTVGETQYILNAGDSIVFDSTQKHAYFNQKDSLLKMTIINYYLI